MGKVSAFYDFAEQMVRYTYEQQGGWIGSAILQLKSNDSEILMFTLPSRLDGASAVGELKSVIEQKSVTAYVVAYEALQMGSSAEDAELDQGNYALDYIDGDPGLFTADAPERVLYMFMASIGGAARVRAFEINSGPMKSVGKRLRRHEVVSSPFSNLFE